mmetsp:Transcript_15777/g.45282  ORF Transcript_15777/g.45282 Transcript_15777/m.45282 type:complete len:303 (-) Transcript_15777:727-1635(-)
MSSSSVGVAKALSHVAGSFKHLMRAVKVVPSPGTDVARMMPPCSFAMPCATERPKPTPWKVRVSLPSSCSKGSKIRFIAAGAMPGPVSMTWSSTKPRSASCDASMLIVPLAVNLQELVRRLYNICVSLLGSPRTTGRDLWRTLLISLTFGFSRGLPALSTAPLVMLMTSRMICRMFTGCCGMAEISPRRFCMSRLNCAEFSIMLLTRSRSRSAQPWIMLSCFFCCLSAVDSAIAADKPRMPCNGLRSSCETMDSKRPCRSSRAFCATCSVRSWATTMMLDESCPNCMMKLARMGTCNTSSSP